MIRQLNGKSIGRRIQMDLTFQAWCTPCVRKVRLNSSIKEPWTTWGSCVRRFPPHVRRYFLYEHYNGLIIQKIEDVPTAGKTACRMRRPPPRKRQPKSAAGTRQP